MSRKTQVAIIGAGPAGLTAAIYLKRAMLDVVIIDKYAPGGKVNNTAHIENYPGYELINGPELATKMYEQALSLGAEVSYGNVQKVDKVGDSLIVTTDEETIEATYVIVASGTSERLLDVPGEATYTNRGVSYCAVCDGSFYKGEEVAVVGGGNAALEESLYLSTIVKKIYLIHRRQGFRASAIIVDKVKNTPNIELVLDSVPLEIVGEKVVDGIKIQNVLTKEESIIPVKAVFPFIGQNPNTDFVKHLGVTTEAGFIVTNHELETSIKNLYAAGDCVDQKIRQIVVAAGDGAVAALNIAKHSAL